MPESLRARRLCEITGRGSRAGVPARSHAAHGPINILVSTTGQDGPPADLWRLPSLPRNGDGAPELALARDLDIVRDDPGSNAPIEVSHRRCPTFRSKGGVTMHPSHVDGLPGVAWSSWTANAPNQARRRMTSVSHQGCLLSETRIPTPLADWPAGGGRRPDFVPLDNWAGRARHTT